MKLTLQNVVRERDRHADIGEHIVQPVAEIARHAGFVEHRRGQRRIAVEFLVDPEHLAVEAFERIVIRPFPHARTAGKRKAEQ